MFKPGTICWLQTKQKPLREDPFRVALLMGSTFDKEGHRTDLWLLLLKVNYENDEIIDMVVSEDHRGNRHESGYTKISAANLIERDEARCISPLGNASDTDFTDAKCHILSSKFDYVLQRYLQPIVKECVHI
jgi:hypothetical protein